MITFDWSGPPILDAAAVDAPFGNLIVLGDDGSFTGFDTATGDSTPLGGVELTVFEAEEPGGGFITLRHALHASDDGSFVAVVMDGGEEGVVYDTRSRRLTMRLHADDYHANTVPFSLCFVRHDGRDVVVHRTAWNRLDASEAATGRLLTDRVSPVAGNGGQSEHYLDYFHGRLLANPSRSRVVDDGWVWQPMSLPRAWSTDAWLDGNEWESEDGPSLSDLITKDDWGTAMCWLDDHHLAIDGLASWDDDDAGIEAGDGIRIMDVRVENRETDRRLPTEAPASALFSDGGSIFAVSDGITRRWDIATRILVEEHGFAASHFDQRRNELIAVSPGTIGSQVILSPGSGERR